MTMITQYDDGKICDKLEDWTDRRENVEFLFFEHIDFTFVGLHTLGDMGFNIRFRNHVMYHEVSEKIVRCSAVLLASLEKDK